MLLPVMSKMQSNKLTVPVERDLKMNNSLFKYFFDICFGEGKTTGEPWGTVNLQTFQEGYKKIMISAAV